MSISQLDLDVRLQLAGQKYSQLSNILSNDLKWGRKCNDLNLLFLLNVYIEIVECYEIDNENNCITEEQLNTIFNNISKLTKMCFQSYGYTYTP